MCVTSTHIMSVENNKRNISVETKHFTARIDRRLIDELERRAKANDRSAAAELRQILRDAFRDEIAA